MIILVSHVPDYFDVTGSDIESQLQGVPGDNPLAVEDDGGEI